MGVFDDFPAPQAAAELPAPQPDASPRVQGAFDAFSHGPAASGAFDSFVQQQENPNQQRAAAPAPPPPEEDPGFVPDVAQAGLAGVQEGGRKVADLWGALRSKMSGGTFFPQEQQAPPELPPAVDYQLKRDITQGWSDPKWWGVQVAHGLGSSLPELASAGAGGLAGGQAGAVAGYGISSGVLALVPKFRQAQAAGLPPDEAAHRAIAESIMEGGFAAASMAAFGVPILGTTARTVGAKVVADALKHPFLEAATQLGLVQPALGLTHRILESKLEGRDLTPGEAISGWAADAGLGALQMGIFHAASKLRGSPRAEITEEGIRSAFEAQRGEPAAEATAASEELVPRIGPVFYSQVARTVAEKGPENASAGQWLATIRNAPGVKPEEVEQLALPMWLGDRSKIEKADLLAHIEENQIRVEEVNLQSRGGAEVMTRGGFRPEGRPQYEQYTLPGPRERYGELLLKLPDRASENQAEHDRLSEELRNRPPSESEERARTILRRLGELAAERKTIRETAFSAPHFNTESGLERNLLAHARYTERFDRDRKRTLFVEEIQSDWHQQGREEGYKGRKVDTTAYEKFDAAYAAARRNTDRIVNVANIRENVHRAIENRDVMNDGGRDLRSLLDQLGRIRGPDVQARMSDYAERYADRAREHDNMVRGVPDAPFKSSWHELVVKRMLRYAADNGYDRIAWTNGEQQVARYPGLAEGQKRGLREFYDKIVPRTFEKWGKKLQMEGGETRIGGPAITRPEETAMRATVSGQQDLARASAVRYLDLSPAAASRIQVGFPLFDEQVKPQVRVVEEPKKPEIGEATELRPAARLSSQIIKELQKKFGITGNIEIQIHTGIDPTQPFKNGQYHLFADGSHRIEVWLGRMHSAEEIYSTMSHEFGHAVFYQHFEKASDATKAQLKAAHQTWAEQMARANVRGTTYREGELTRTNVIRNFYSDETFYNKGEFPLSSMSPEQWKYWASFEEWLAEQTAKWATTEARPLSLVDKLFSSLGRRIRQVAEFFSQKTGRTFQPHQAVKDWFEDLMKNGEPFAAQIMDAAEWRQRAAAKAAVTKDGTPEAPTVPQTATTGGGRNIIDKLPPEARDAGRAAASHADRFNKVYEWMLSLPQMVSRNPHIRGLVYYGELHSLRNLRINTTMNSALETLHAWRRLGRPQSDALSGLIEDYMLQSYRSQEEQQKGLTRKPTAEEFKKLVLDNRVGDPALKLFQKLIGDMSDLKNPQSVLSRYRDHMKLEAGRIKDPIRQAQKMQDVDEQVGRMANQPYFPMMRFGNKTITVYDHTGKVVRFELAENARKQAQAAKLLEPTLLPGERIRIGELEKDVVPFVGLPPGLLESLAGKLDLSTTQRARLDELRLDYSPARSFRQRFQRRERIPGWSEDYKRAYAQYFFSFSRWMANAELVEDMRGRIDEVRKSSRELPNGVARDQIANYMAEHLNQVMNPKADFAHLRSALFHWFLGFSPASATLNMSQTLMATYPFLARQFGDFKAIGAMTRAHTSLGTFYKAGKLTTETAGDLRALGEAVREGVISEGQAHMLGALSEYDNLSRRFGGTSTQQVAQKVLGWSSFMFDQTEQYNRRVAFRAAWKLALENPNAEYVTNAAKMHPLQYERLIDRGWTPSEARAFTAAKDTVESTQYIYAPYARPKFMWGKKGSLFAFKSFTQNTLFQMWNYPGSGARSLLLLAGLGGMMGLPGAEDINGLLKGIAWHLFGKDFDLDDEARKFAVDTVNGKIDPEILLHGLSRHGFGIPQLLDMMGGTVGLDKHIPFPSLDRSAAVGMGNVLPIEPGRLLGPSKDSNAPIAASAQRVAGAGFGLAFALYKALFASQQDMTDFKRWEQVMPHAISNASHAYRYYSEGMEKNSAGNPVLRFDPHETEQMFEILARAAGYQPSRLTEQWDRLRAESEAKTYWQLREQALLRQLWTARRSSDSDSYQSVLGAIRKFNGDLPDEARGYRISSDKVRQSFQARAKAAAGSDLGIPTQKRDIPLVREAQRLHPGAEPIGRPIPVQ